jgi:hypothetical protein
MYRINGFSDFLRSPDSKGSNNGAEGKPCVLNDISGTVILGLTVSRIGTSYLEETTVPEKVQCL